MSSVPALSTLLLCVLYPVWLLAGAVDWLCHRATHIETTSGSHESWLHLAQFLSLAGFLAVVMLRPYGATALFASGTAVAIHTALSYVDVRYTLKRGRFISSLEQHVHGFLDVIPWVAFALWIVMNLQNTSPAANAWHMETRGTLLVLGSYAVLAGSPVLNELRRTLRFRPSVRDG